MHVCKFRLHIHMIGCTHVHVILSKGRWLTVCVQLFFVECVHMYAWKSLPCIFFLKWRVRVYACDFEYATQLFVCHESSICVPWLIHLCGMTHSSVCHASCICVPWLIHLCAMTHSSVCHDSFICVPYPIHLHAITCSSVCHGAIRNSCRLPLIRAISVSLSHWYRLAKTHRVPDIAGHFPQKSH